MAQSTLRQERAVVGRDILQESPTAPLCETGRHKGDVRCGRVSSGVVHTCGLSCIQAHHPARLSPGIELVSRRVGRFEPVPRRMVCIEVADNNCPRSAPQSVGVEAVLTGIV